MGKARAQQFSQTRSTEDGGLGARATERACGAATPSFRIAAEPPSLLRDRRRNTPLLVHATAAAVAAPIRVAGARGLASSQSGGRSSLARTRRRAGYLAAEADDRDGLGRAPAKEPATAGAIGEAAALAPAADAPAACLPAACAQQVYSHLTRSSTSRQRPVSVQTASRQRPDSVQTASRQQNRSV